MVDTKRLAAQYVRMSTERQDYSLEFQKATNAAYAIEHGLNIVATYEDAGVSGLSIANRDGLKTLLADVLAGRATFSTILVYDVSRWGRFQNPDQAAHYEFICSEAGVKIVYCAETFENDGSPTSALLKHLKRAMAAEYSRELSAKVSKARRGLLAEGFWTGGQVPFAYRRVFALRDGRTTPASSNDYVRKQQGVRTKLVLGPPDEVDLIRRIFKLYLRPGASFTTVSRTLARTKGVPGEIWSPKRVAAILRNEIFVGRLVGGRRIRAVGESWGLPAPREHWIVAENAVPAIVSEETFQAARRKRLKRTGPIPKKDLIDDLKRVGREGGDVSQRVIQQYGKWSTGTYTRALVPIGSIREMLGMPVPEKYSNLGNQLHASNRQRQNQGQTYTDQQLVDRLRELLAIHGHLSVQVIDSCAPPLSCTFARRFGGMKEVYRQAGYEPRPAQVLAIASAAKRDTARYR